MGKILIIKGADFSQVAVGKVEPGPTPSTPSGTILSFTGNIPTEKVETNIMLCQLQEWTLFCKVQNANVSGNAFVFRGSNDANGVVIDMQNWPSTPGLWAKMSQSSFYEADGISYINNLDKTLTKIGFRKVGNDGYITLNGTTWNKTNANFADVVDETFKFTYGGANNVGSIELSIWADGSKDISSLF